MNRFGLYCLQCVVGVVGVVGVSASLWFLALIYGFLAFGKDHPVNAALRIFGAKPLALNLSEIMEMSVYGLIPLVLSITTAICIYVSLAVASALVTYKSILALDERLSTTE